jgi:hypothetical protein
MTDRYYRFSRRWRARDGGEGEWAVITNDADVSQQFVRLVACDPAASKLADPDDAAATMQDDLSDVAVADRWRRGSTGRRPKRVAVPVRLFDQAMAVLERSAPELASTIVDAAPDDDDQGASSELAP